MSNFRPSMRRIIETTETSGGRFFDATIQVLILISLAGYTAETLPGLSAAQISTLVRLELFCISIFSIEYLLRVWVAENRVRYIFSFYGLVDLAAIAPFYFATGLDLRSLRAVRLLRVFRILKLVRYNAALTRIDLAFNLAKAELVLFLSASTVVIFLAGVGIYHFENPAQPESFASIPDSLWWAVVTLTTVGYGDMYPITAGGRFFTTIILFVGLGLVAVPAGIISSALSEARKLQREQPNTK